MLAALLKPSLNWLLIFIPITAWLEFGGSQNHIAIFACACLAILPLAGWLGEATEHLATRAGETVGGLLNATFGNAAELIIALMALQKGLYPVVKASLTGSIIGNILLVFGASCLAGGLKFPTQRFNAGGAQSQSTMLMLATGSLVIPAVFHHLAAAALGPAQAAARDADLSLEISVILMICYALSLWFSLKTHKQLFSSTSGEAEEHTGPGWSNTRSLVTLGIATALIAWMSEVLVGSVEQAAHSLGMTSIFVGVIVVAIIGNAAEHSTAILVALKNRMDLAYGIAVGSSLQIALFVAPLLVLLSHVTGPKPMDLLFTPPEIAAIAIAVVINGQISADGESNWFEGVLLLAVYCIIGLMFYFLPEHA